MAIISDSYAESFGFPFIDGGGVTDARGFRAAGIHGGFRDDPERLDMALVVADEPAVCAGVFTRNAFCAAPVQLCRQRLAGDGLAEGSWGTARAVVINSGIANAATGSAGLERACQAAAVTAAAVGCPEEEMLEASTGVIGVHLPLEPFEASADAAVGALDRGPDANARAARAIMTTDTKPKHCAVAVAGETVGLPGRSFAVGGMAKGAGMIMPNMATMIAVITTDLPLHAPDAHRALVRAVAVSFNRITVDSDTSTNDSCFLMASGAGAPDGFYLEPGTEAFAAFERALTQVCTALARAMAADGEGATRLVTVTVEGAATASDADAAARTVANSPLVKTAIYGHDANWGRIAAALGRSGAAFLQENVDIDILGMPVCRGGLTVPFDEEEALARFEAPEISIRAHLGAGECAATLWTCDFSHEYVTINGDYRS